MQTAINYPVALPFLKAYWRFNHRSLPMFAEITSQQQQTVVDLVRGFG